MILLNYRVNDEIYGFRNIVYLDDFGACSIQSENDTNQDHLSTADLLHLSPVITMLENLPDSLQPQRVMLRDTPVPKQSKYQSITRLMNLYRSG
jgi:hypothetical protein